ncbi:MAG: S-layer homology domain-containing protein [Clostridia bacterium]|nr:S-layer homology domain-containing protein [Clostridia bacterium]
MLKRFFALFLILTLGLSMLFALPVSAADASKCQLVYDLGIVEEPGNFGLIPKSFSRASFAHTLTVMSKTMHNEDVTDESAAKYASDIAANEYASDIINVLAMGYMQTDEEGKFNPSNPVTKTEALVSFVKALGYEAIVKEEGGDLGDYVNLASKIGLFKGVTIADEEKLTTEEVAEITANAMGVPFVTYKNISGGPGCLWEVWELSDGTGTIEANSRIGIGVPKVGANRVRINGITLYSRIEIPNELVGAEVTYYTVPGVHGDEVISIYAYNTEENITLAADEIGTVTDKGKYIEITDVDEEEILVDKQGLLIINGKAWTPTKALFGLLDSGSATFLDTDDDGRYDVIHMTLLHQAIVEGVNGSTLTLRTGKDKQIVDFSDIDVMEVYIGKKIAKISDIKAGMVVGIACDSFTISNGVITWGFADAKYAQLYASDRSETGMIEKMEGTDSFTINGRKRYYGSGYKRFTQSNVLPELKLGFYIEAFYDNYGKLTYYKVISGAEGLNYGYLIAGGVDGGPLDKVTMLKIMDINGNFLTLKTSPRFILDGVMVDSGSTSYSVNGVDDVDLKQRQLIRYRVYDDVIREVDTAVVRTVKEDAATSLDMQLDAGSKSYVRLGVVNNRYGFTSDAVVFVDSAPAMSMNPAEKLFSVIKASQLNNSQFYLKGYDADEDNMLSCLVRIDSNEIVEVGETTTSLLDVSEYCYVVEKVIKSMDEQGNHGWTLSLAGDGNRMNYFIPEDTLLLYRINSDNMTTGERPTLIREDAADFDTIINRGDVIRFRMNDAGEITYLEKMFDFGSHQDTTIPMPDNSYHISAFVRIDKIIDNKFIFDYDGISDGTRLISGKTQKYSNTVLYHVKTDRVELIPFSELPSAATGNTVKAYVRYYNYRIFDNIFYIYD